MFTRLDYSIHHDDRIDLSRLLEPIIVIIFFRWCRYGKFLVRITITIYAVGRLFFPSQCCCSEHCGIGVHEVADEEFCLASEDGQHALVVGCLYGSHDEVA